MADEARPELIHVNPASLTTLRNVRTDLQLSEDFVASVREHGVLVPIVAVRLDDGGLAVEYGHRRTAAAVLAGRTEVPVVVVPANGEAARVAAQVVENQHRLGLSTADAAAAHGQMALLGMSIADAARATATPQKQVAALRSAAARPADVVRAMDMETLLALDTAAADGQERAALEEVFGQRGKHEALRAAQRLLDGRAEAAALAAAAEEWAAAGYTVLADPPDDSAEVQLRDLTGGDGEPLEHDDHTDCPGRAVHLFVARYDGSVRATEACLDPQMNGHRLDDWLTNSRQQEQAAAQDPEQRRDQRREVIANNTHWRAAQAVRRTHVAGWLSTAKPGPDAMRWALAELAGRGLQRNAWLLARGVDELGWAKDVLRHDGQRLGVSDRAGRDRAAAGVLALVLADRELGTGTHSWRSVDPATAAYLQFLADRTGYDLGDVERRAAGLDAAPPQDHDEEDGTDAGQGQDRPDTPAAQDHDEEDGTDAGQGEDRPRWQGSADIGADRATVRLTPADWGVPPDAPDADFAARSLNRAAGRVLRGAFPPEGLAGFNAVAARWPAAARAAEVISTLQAQKQAALAAAGGPVADLAGGAGQDGPGREVGGRRFEGGAVLDGDGRPAVSLTARDWGLFTDHPAASAAAAALNRAAEAGLLLDPAAAWRMYEAEAAEWTSLGGGETEGREAFSALLDGLAGGDPRALGADPPDPLDGPPLSAGDVDGPGAVR